jgi:peptide/nickel transport system substrate-binding protein
MNTQRLTRREFLRRSATGAAAASLSPVFLSRLAAAQGRGTVTVGLPADILNFDPSAKSFVTYPIIRQVYNRLHDYDLKYTPQPELATSWKIADDRKSVAFKLRPGVKFHNGRTLTSKDIVAVFERAMDPKVGQNLVTLTSGQGMSAVRAPDESTVVFEYAFQTPNILDTIQEIDIVAPEAFGQLAQTTVGTGPFKVVEWIPGDHVTLARHDTYWKPGLPALDRVILKPFSNLDAMATALQTGTIDAGVGLPYAQVERLKAQKTLVLAGDNTGAFLNIFYLNPQKEPFTNKGLRQALQYALDRQTIVRTVYAGLADVRVAPYPPNSIAYNPTLDKRYTFDLAKAKQMMAQAGFPKGVKFTIILTTAGPDYAQIAQIVKADLAKIGVDMTIELVDNARWTPRLFAGDFQATISFVALNKDPLTLFRNSPYRTFNSPPFPKGNFPAGYAETINAARRTVTKEFRYRLFTKIQEILLDESWAQALSSHPIIFGWNAGVHGFAWNIDVQIALEQTRKG